MRHLIAELLQISAAELPLQAPPGQAPELTDGWGFVSLSHCPDALLVAWSPWRIGVDLERADRRIPADALVRRFFLQRGAARAAGAIGSAAATSGA